MKINFGCGTNRLPGWTNVDSEVDISKPLPYPDDAAELILCEHCVEHVTQYQAIEFFKECRRVLKPGGIVRIVVPSIEQIRACNDQEYFSFTTRFHKEGATSRGAMHNIIACHGHKAIWTISILEALLEYVGFKNIKRENPGASSHPQLCNVEGHHKVITKRWNDIESCVAEATANKVATVKEIPKRKPLLQVKIECGEVKGPFPQRMMSDADRMALIGLLRSINCKRFVEFGVHEGFTAKVILDNVTTIHEYVGVDVTPDYVPAIAAQLKEVPRDPAHLVKDDPRFKLIVTPRGSLDLTPAGLGVGYDAILIDGDHSHDPVCQDTALARMCVRPGGLVIWHDYTNVGDVVDVLENSAASGDPILNAEGSWIAFEKRPTSNVAVVVGGAEQVWEEVDEARKLCAMAGAEITFFIINDMIAKFPFPGIGVTLHPDQLQKWLGARAASGFMTLRRMWSNRDHRSGLVTNHVKDLGGSSGLFAAYPVAMQGMQFKKVILCGVPMAVSSNHFVRHTPWNACTSFQRCWGPHMAAIKPFVRSFSGWTAEQLGKPDAAFLAS